VKTGVAAAVVAVLLAAGCSGGYEQALVGQFFTASRLLDRTALAEIATVIFDPRTDGTVLRFDVDRITPEDHGQKRVIVIATVHLPSGKIIPETLVLTLRRADPAVDKGTMSKWIITKVANDR